MQNAYDAENPPTRGVVDHPDFKKIQTAESARAEGKTSAAEALGEMIDTMDELNQIESKLVEPFISWEPPYLVCTCGWRYKHTRLKVLNKAILKHTTKYGHEFKEKK